MLEGSRGKVVKSAVLRELVEGSRSPVETVDAHAVLAKAKKIKMLTTAQERRRWPGIPLRLLLLSKVERLVQLLAAGDTTPAHPSLQSIVVELVQTALIPSRAMPVSFSTDWQLLVGVGLIGDLQQTLGVSK